MIQKFLRPKLFILLIAIVGMAHFEIYAQITKQIDFYQTPEITILTGEDGEQYSKITMEDLYETYEEGAPLLPYKRLNLIIGSDQDVGSIEFTAGDEEIINLRYPVFPVQQDIPTSIHRVKTDFKRPDRKIYDSNKPFPENIVRVVSSGYFDATNHIVGIEIYPIQYLPKSKKVVFYKNISFTVETTPKKESVSGPLVRTRSSQELYDGLLESIVDNPEDIGRFQNKPMISEELLGPCCPLPIYKYVIITPNQFKSAFNKFVTWKKRKGISIGVVTTEEIYANYTGDLVSGIFDNAGRIRQYLKDAYTCGETAYALLGGDYNFVPIRYGAGIINCDWGDLSYYRIPADLYFADFNGDWDVDGQDIDGFNRYGEPNGTSGDNVDHYPEIFVGRLLCSSTTDITNWINKVIKYEENPGKGDLSYLTRSLMNEADEMQRDLQAEYVRDYLPTTFQHTILKELPSYDSQSPTYPKGSDLITKMRNDRYGLWSWFNHGCPVGYDAMNSGVNVAPRYMVTTIDSYPFGVSDYGNGLDLLLNSDYPAVVYSICCTVTPFDDFNPGGWYTGYRNVGEGFTAINANGGPNFLGNTRWGWLSTSYQLYRRFAELINSTNQNNLHMGVSELLSKSNYGNHYLSLTHNLVGCPETILYKSTPSKFNNVVITDNGTSLTVNANVSGSTITVMSTDGGATYYSSIANVTSYTFYTSVRPLCVTVSKINYLPFVFKANITGPTSLNSGQQGTWTANVTWGMPSYSYKWYYMHPAVVPEAISNELLAPGDGEWYLFGTNSSTASRSDTRSFQLKCEITDGSGAEGVTNIYSVTVTGSEQLLKQGDNDVNNEMLPTEYSLLQNYPNPFNPATQIVYDIKESGFTTLKVFNTLGEEVVTLVNEIKVQGRYTIYFNAADLPSGVYIYKLTSGNFSSVKKMVLAK